MRWLQHLMWTRASCSAHTLRTSLNGGSQVGIVCSRHAMQHLLPSPYPHNQGPLPYTAVSGIPSGFVMCVPHSGQSQRQLCTVSPRLIARVSCAMTMQYQTARNRPGRHLALQLQHGIHITHKGGTHSKAALHGTHARWQQPMAHTQGGSNQRHTCQVAATNSTHARWH
jgi:hypothetical protein